jgi:signal transduction histidine kinase
MRATLRSDGTHEKALEAAIRATGRLEVPVWVLDLPLEEALALAPEAPPRARLFAVFPAEAGDAPWAHLGQPFDDILVGLPSAAALQARLRHLATRNDPDRVARSRSLRLLAHDVNNPLTAIRLLAEMLTMEMRDEESRQDMQDILEASDLAGALVESLSAAARLDHPPAPNPATAVDLGPLLREVARRPALRDHVRVEVPDQPVVVHGDKARIKQALTDILLNARRLTEGRPATTAVLQVLGPPDADRSEALLTLSLPVTTLEPEHRAALMLPWGAWLAREARLQVSATGLAHVAAVARQLDGALDLSTGSAGTTLRLTLPLAGSPRTDRVG